jgi:hypothetical protein
MDYNKIINHLSRNREVFKNLLFGLDKTEYLWKSKPDKWCLLEIICHLFDEEREDFRARIFHLFENPELLLPQIDPPGWVQERIYIQQNYSEKLDNFLKERERSVKQLRALTNPNWTNEYNHPVFGKMTPKLILSNWLAHDYLHQRQIIRVKYEYLKNLSDETLSYAGEW